MLPCPRRVSRWWAVVVATTAIVSVVMADDPPAKPKLAEEKLTDPREIQKKITDLMRGGNPDPDEIRRLMEEMTRQMRDQMLQPRGRGGFQFQRQGGRFNPFTPAEPAKPALRVQYEKRLEEFDADIAKNADNPDAQSALKKARAAYVEAMADELKKADAKAKENPPAAQAPAFPNIQFGGGIQVIPFPAFPGFGNPFGAAPEQASRLGTRVERPSEVLAEQLDLPAGKGVVLTAVVGGSPADRAGLRKGDVLTAVGGKAVPNDPAAFSQLVEGLKAGEKLDAEIIRKGKKETLKGIELPPTPKPEESVRVAFTQMQTQVNNGKVSIRATAADGTTYAVTGTAEDGSVVPSNIVIDDGEKKEYPSLEKVPEKHRPAVRQLLGQVRVFGRR